MFLDAPHTSNLRWSCLALIALSGCDALTQFDFELDEALRSQVAEEEFRRRGAVDGGFGSDEQGYDQLRPPGFAGLEMTQLPSFSDQGVGVEHVDSLTLLDLTIMAQPESVRDPYAYLEAMRFVAIAGDQEIELAQIEGEALWQSERELVLSGPETNLKVLLEQPTTISLRLKGNQPLGNRSFTVKARFRVDLF